MNKSKSKYIIVCLLVIFLMGCSKEENVTVESKEIVEAETIDKVDSIIPTEIETIVEDSGFDTAVKVSFKARNKDKFDLNIYKDGKKILIQGLDSVKKSVEDRYIFGIGMKKGVIDENGEVLIGNKFDSIEEKNGEYFCNDYASSQYYVMDKNGEFLFKVQCSEIEPLGNNYKIFQKSVYKHGLIDKNGKELIANKYMWIRYYTDDYVVVKGDERKHRIVDLNDKEIANQNFDEIQNVEYFRKDEKIAITRRGKSYGMVNNGVVVVDPYYDKIVNFFFKKVTRAKKGDNISIINDKGKVLIENIDEEMTSLVRSVDANKNNYSVVRKDGEWIVLDYEGNKKSMGKDFTSLSFIGNVYDENGYGEYKDLLIYYKDNKTGLMDLEGNILNSISDLYKIEYIDRNGLIHISKGDRFGKMDMNGRIIMDTKFDSDIDFKDFKKNGKRYGVCSIDGKYGLINEDLEYIIEPKYSYISIINDGIFKVELNGEYAIMDINENILLPFSMHYYNYNQDKNIIIRDDLDEIHVWDTNLNQILKLDSEKSEIFYR